MCHAQITRSWHVKIKEWGTTIQGKKQNERMVNKLGGSSERSGRWAGSSRVPNHNNGLRVGKTVNFGRWSPPTDLLLKLITHMGMKAKFFHKKNGMGNSY